MILMISGEASSRNWFLCNEFQAPGWTAERIHLKYQAPHSSRHSRPHQMNISRPQRPRVYFACRKSITAVRFIALHSIYIPFTDDFSPSKKTKIYSSTCIKSWFPHPKTMTFPWSKCRCLAVCSPGRLGFHLKELFQDVLQGNQLQKVGRGTTISTKKYV